MVVVPLFPSFLSSLSSPSSSSLGTGCWWNDRSGLNRGLAWIWWHQGGLSFLWLIRQALRWRLWGAKRRTCFIRMIEADGDGPEIGADKSRGFKIINHKLSSPLVEQVFCGKKKTICQNQEQSFVFHLNEISITVELLLFDARKSHRIKPRVTANKCSFDIAVSRQDHQTSKAMPFVLTPSLHSVSHSATWCQHPNLTFPFFCFVLFF